MNTFTSLKRFPSESACKECFLAQSFKKGIIRKKYQNRMQYWLTPNEQLQFHQCRFLTAPQNRYSFIIHQITLAQFVH